MAASLHRRGAHQFGLRAHHATVRDLRARVKQIKKMDAEWPDGDLMATGKTLQDDNTLDAYNLQKDSTINYLFSAKGSFVDR